MEKKPRSTEGISSAVGIFLNIIIGALILNFNGRAHLKVPFFYNDHKLRQWSEINAPVHPGIWLPPDPTFCKCPPSLPKIPRLTGNSQSSLFVRLLRMGSGFVFAVHFPFRLWYHCCSKCRMRRLCPPCIQLQDPSLSNESMNPERKHSVCPVERAGSLDMALRRLLQNPRKILAPFIKEGMTVLEIPDKDAFFREITTLLKPDGGILTAEPHFHVSQTDFVKTLKIAESTGLAATRGPKVFFSKTAILKKGEGI
jgi:hypothetical protein